MDIPPNYRGRRSGVVNFVHVFNGKNSSPKGEKVGMHPPNQTTKEGVIFNTAFMHT